MKKRSNLKSYFLRSSPVILTLMGTAGVIATAAMAAKETPKALKVLDAAKKEKGEALTKMEIVRIAGPVYIPTVLTGLSTVACIWGANILSRKNQASLMSAYALLGKSYKKYREAAGRVYGEDADSKIKAEMAKDTYITADGWSLYSPDLDTENEKMLFYDFYSQRYFTSTAAAVINAQYHLNRNLILKGVVWLNDYYEFLGIDLTEQGDTVGWNMEDFLDDGIQWLDFENEYTVLEDGLKCCIISFAFDPKPFDVE